MPKKRSRKTPSERPPWFNITLESGSPYGEGRIREGRAGNWIRETLRQWREPKSGRQLALLWAMLCSGCDEIKRRLDAKDWSQATPWELVSILDKALSIRLGAMNFLPDPYRNLPFDDLAFYYVNAFLFAGLAEHAEHHPEKVLNPALTMLFYSMAGQYVLDEIGRRGRRHVGFRAAALKLLLAARRSAPGNQEEEREMAELLAELEGRITVPPEHYAALQEGFDLGATSAEAKCESVYATLRRSQILLTLDKEWSGQDPIESLARSLQGELNVFPRAVKHDLMDEARSTWRRRESPEEEPRPADKTQWFDADRLETEDVGAEIARILKLPRKERKVVEFLLSRHDAHLLKHSEIAEEAGTSLSTVEKTLQRLRKNWSQIELLIFPSR